MSLKQNNIATEPSLRNLLDLFKKEIFLSLNCHAIGTIQSFDSTKQTASITINYQKTFVVSDAQGVQSNEYVGYPILIDCPVIVLQGGSGRLTFPIASGDSCILLFNDRDIDGWILSGQVGPVSTQRLHSFSDAMALVGIRDFEHALSNYDATHVVLQNDAAKIALSSSKISVRNDTRNLNTLLQNIVSELRTLTDTINLITVTCASAGNPSGPPLNSASFTAINTQLQTYATELGELLE